MRVLDVLVAGAGPAGLAAAAACAQDGLDVAVVAPRPHRPWHQTYGAWLDDLPEGVPLAARWQSPRVLLGAGREHELPRPYGLLDNAELQASLCRSLGGGVRDAAVEGIEPAADGLIAVCGDQRLRTRLLLDATGAGGPLGRLPERGPAPAVQAAYGLVGRVRGGARWRAALPEGGMVLMDWRELRGLPGREQAPTFLYAMDLGWGRALVEETSLARRPALSLDVLRARLEARLHALGARLEAVEAVERVAIPMGGGLPQDADPASGGTVVALGAAAGVVHPATGYSVATSLRRAQRIATAARVALDSEPAPAERAARVRRSVVDADERAQRALHLVGLESLLRLGGDATRDFFDAFFALPQHRWEGYLSGAADAGALATTMLVLFAHAPWRVRAQLIAGLGTAVAASRTTS